VVVIRAGVRVVDGAGNLRVPWRIFDTTAPLTVLAQGGELYQPQSDPVTSGSLRGIRAGLRSRLEEYLDAK